MKGRLQVPRLLRIQRLQSGHNRITGLKVENLWVSGLIIQAASESESDPFIYDLHQAHQPLSGKLPLLANSAIVGELAQPRLLSLGDPLLYYFSGPVLHAIAS